MTGNFLLLILHVLCLSAAVALFIVGVPAALRVGEKLKPVFILLLAATIILGIWFRFDHSPHRFKVFYVEYEINNIARMIAGEGDFSVCTAGTFEKCEDRQPPVYATGFPFMGAAAMRLTGRYSPNVLFTLNSVLGVLCIPVVFIMAMAAAGSARTALFASFAASVLPLNVILSGNATTETADLLFLCITFTFLFLYLRNKDALSGAGLFSAIVFSILLEPRNAYTAAFILIVLLAAGPHDLKKILAALAGAALIAALIFVLPPVYRSAFALPPGGYPGVVKTNIIFLFSNQYIPFFVSIPLFVAPVFLGRRCGVSRPLFFFVFVSILAISLLDIHLPLGDFPRFMLPATIPLILFFGITADWLLDVTKSIAVRNGLVTLCLAVFLFSSFNVSLVVLRDFAEAQDDFIADRLPKVVDKCSVFSVNPSIGMTYTDNPNYEITQLLDGAFMEKHRRCKVVVFEMECATGRKEICSKVFSKFAPRELFSENIFNYYYALISLIPADTGTGKNSD